MLAYPIRLERETSALHIVTRASPERHAKYHYLSSSTHKALGSLLPTTRNASVIL